MINILFLQQLSDHNFLIRNVRICPGSNNDRHVWNGSDMKQYLEQLQRNVDILVNEGPYYLIGLLANYLILPHK